VPARVAAWLERHGGPRPGEAIVVGCSGGGDSSALALALAACGRGPLTLVYVDHGLRAGTDGEADRVAELAARIGAHAARVRVAVERRGNLLARAREARYRALVDQARGAGARWVAVGHTASDQAETVLWRARRGDPAPALAGIPPVRPLDGERRLIRPLGEVTRAEADAYARACGVQPVADPTNARPELARTRSRALLSRAPALAGELWAIGACAAALAAEIDRRAEQLGAIDAIAAADLAAAGPAVAAALLRRAGLHRAGAAHARALVALAAGRDGTRSIDLGGGLVAERSYQRVRIGPPATAPAAVEVAIVGPGDYFLEGWRIRIGEQEMEAGAGDPFVLRFARDGDWALTWVGRRKLSDLMIDQKVPRPARRAIALVARGAEVVAIGEPLLARRIAGVQPVHFQRLSVEECRLTPG
jgi:tRNA(Ile)-lysidine synthase